MLIGKLLATFQRVLSSGSCSPKSYSSWSAYRSVAALDFITVCSTFFSKDFSFTEESQC
jgi:hypothetical protein